ncbi:MAG: hypothetical protein LVQ97_05155 [Candidatus Micrarchaeales archaeon]|jgi:hypothetical protein|nr:hypothetical protein [Candidatus Micrarchaeales archaeon]
MEKFKNIDGNQKQKENNCSKSSSDFAQLVRTDSAETSKSESMKRSRTRTNTQKETNRKEIITDIAKALVIAGFAVSLYGAGTIILTQNFFYGGAFLLIGFLETMLSVKIIAKSDRKNSWDAAGKSGE